MSIYLQVSILLTMTKKCEYYYLHEAKMNMQVRALYTVFYLIFYLFT